MENGRFAFSAPLWGVKGGGLEATYDVHFRLVRKRAVDFILALIDFFSLGVTAKALRANID